MMPPALMRDSSATDASDASPATRKPADWSTPGRFAGLLAIFIFASFWNVLSGLDTFAVRDFGLFSYPCAYFFRQCFGRGELPFWNPYSCCGVPFLAQFNTLSLYPLSIIYLILPLAWALPFFCLLHLFLGGMGAYFLAERWTGSRAGAALAGVVFAFNGLALNFLMWPSHIATFAWIPWVIYLTERGWREGGRRLVPAALAAAMEVLGGGPESILFTWLILLGLALVETGRGSRPWATLVRRFLAVGFLAVGLAAAQVLPFADFALHCSRNTRFAASEWSMPAWGWGNFLVPMFQTWRWLDMSVQLDQYWTSSYYVGVGIIFLAAMAVWRNRGWRVWLLAGFLFASMVLALGDHGFVYLWLRKAVPFLGLFRFPIKFVIITSALFPVLAAFAIGQYEKEPPSPARSWRAEAIGAAAMVVSVVVLLWFARYRPVISSSFSATLNNALTRLGFLAAFLVALWFFVMRPELRARAVLALAVICWFDLATAMPWQNPTLNPSVYQPDLGRLAAKMKPPLPALGESRLMMSVESASRVYNEPQKDLRTTYLIDREVFLSDCNILDGLPKVDGFFSLYLRECDKVLWLIEARHGAELESLEDFLGVAQTTAPGHIYEWRPRPTYQPIVTAGQEPVFADDETALNAIGRTNIDLRHVIYLPEAAKSVVTAKREPGAHITGKQFLANYDSFQVETPAPALVFLTQAFYHNWEALVDGQAVPLWRADYAFQALQVPAGKHVVTLRYQDRMFWIGTLLTGLTAGLCLLIWVRGKGAKVDAIP